MEKRKIAWKRVGDCKACGQNRCMVNSQNENMGYCFRYSSVYFVKRDGKITIAKRKGAEV